MVCLTSTQITELQAQLVAIAAQLVAANAAMLAGPGKPLSYKLDTGEGSQQVRFHSLKELRDHIRYLEGRKRSIEVKLNGRGLVNISMGRCR